MASMLRHFGIVLAAAFLPGAAGTVAVAPTITTITTITTALLAVAVAIGLSHHGRRTGFQFLHPHCHGTQHIFVDVLLPFDLGHRGSRCVHVEQGEMGLTVLADAISQGLNAPILGLCDAAAHLLDDALIVGRKFVDLLLRQILPRQKDMLVQWHAKCLSTVLLRSGAKPLVPFGKGSKA